MPPQLLFDAKEVGAMLGVHWRTVLRLADNGHLDAGIKCGGHLRKWTREHIEEFIRQRNNPTV